MTAQDTAIQTINQDKELRLPHFPSLDAEQTSGLITPREIAFEQDTGLQVTRSQEVRQLKGNEAKAYYRSQLPCVTFSVLPSGQHSGLICIFLKLDQERLAEILPLVDRDPAVYMVMIEIAQRGVYVVLKVNIQHVSQHRLAVDAGVAYIRDQYEFASDELEQVKYDLKARTVLSEVYYTNFSPRILPVAKESTGSEGQNVRVDLVINHPTNPVINGIHADYQKAQESQTKRQVSKDLELDRPTVDAFPTEIFPPGIQQVIKETGMHMNFRPDWIGSAILYAVCVAVGNCYGTRYKKYEQKALIYLAIVGVPGTNKSAPFQYALTPLQAKDDEWYRIYVDELTDYNRWLKSSKKEREAEEGGLDREPPIYKTLLVSDVTQEFLVQTHAQNPIGVGLVMDELAGWLKNFTRYNNGSEEQFWLSVWSLLPAGSGRKGSGVHKIPQPLLPVGGTIQPGVLGELAKNGRDQNGFADRMLFAYPDDQERAYDSETELDVTVTEFYEKFINKLLALRNSAKTDETHKIKTIWLPFADDAFARMREWKNENTDAINKTSVQAIKGILAKLDMYCIRFALLIELMDWSSDQLAKHSQDLSNIRLSSVERAIKLTEYFRQNAVKVHYELNDQTPGERLSGDRQRLFNALPDEVETGEAISIAISLQPPVSESTVKRMLKDTKLFRRVGYGQYHKSC